MTIRFEKTDEGVPGGSLQSAALRVIPALALITLCVVLWHVWVKPTLRIGTAKIATPLEAQSLADLHVKGSRGARVGLIVFSDFECPACGKFARDVLPTIVDKYVATGQVLLAFSDLPLESIHPAALRRAAIAECAGRQGRFWEVHDRLFFRQTSASVEQESVDGLERSALAVCLSSRSSHVVRARLARAEALGIKSTPSLFVGDLDGDGLRVTDAVAGFQSVKQLSAILDRRLKR